MIKGGFIQLDDDFVPALVIRVTACAFELLRFGQSPVQTDFVFQVIAHSDMTAYAQFELWLVRQGIVAIVAGVFQAFMTANDRSRHDQPFLQRRSIRRAGIS